MANIHTARRSGYITRGGKNVRETLWSATSLQISSTITAASTAVVMTSFAAGVLALRPFTIVRTRGVWGIRSDQTASIESQALGLGMAVVTDQAVAIGVTAVPTPGTDADSDAFYVYEVLLQRNIIAGEQPMRFASFDSKAMRKVEDGFDGVSVVETGPASNGLVVELQFRCLIKLH